MNILKFLKDRVSEKGTRSVIIGVVVFAAARFGLELDLETQTALDGLIVAVTAVVVSALKEKSVPEDEESV